MVAAFSLYFYGHGDDDACDTSSREGIQVQGTLLQVVYICKQVAGRTEQVVKSFF
jgi:hypothetical protein